MIYNQVKFSWDIVFNLFSLKYEAPTQMSSCCVFFLSKVENNQIIKQIGK